MAFVTADRVRDTSTTTSTGNITVSGTAPTGFRTFSAVLSVDDTFYYAIQHQSLNEWEVGIGTYSSSNVFARTTVLSSSNAGNLVNFSAGTKDVFITLPAGRVVNVQTFNSSGTWTKPIGFSSDSRVFIQAWGGGGSGARSAAAATCGGGGGGGYSYVWLNLSQMGATETVTIGAGGASRTTTGSGNIGGDSNIGTLLYAYGGGFGTTAVGGYGGGQLGAGDTTNGNPGAPNLFEGSGSVSGGPPSGSLYNGAGGGVGSTTATLRNGAKSVWGGGGGGGGSTVAANNGNGGTSYGGGSGGAGSNTAAVAGTQPGGGGGGGGNTNSGKGGDGRIIVTVFPGAS